MPERRTSDKDCEGKQVRSKRGVNDPEKGGNRSTLKNPTLGSEGTGGNGCGAWGDVGGGYPLRHKVWKLFAAYAVITLYSILHKFLYICVETLTFTVKIWGRWLIVPCSTKHTLTQFAYFCYSLLAMIQNRHSAILFTKYI